MELEAIHHVSLTVRDLEKSREFYRRVLGLEEIARPNFPFPGAWFRVGVGTQQLHLIEHSDGTFRGDKRIDTRDVHFAVRVPSYQKALGFLRSNGFTEDVADTDPRRMVVRPRPTAGFPQIYILDPDHHVIEINAAVLD